MFVRSVSHEVRTPLNTVKMGLELLYRELKDVNGLSPELFQVISDSMQASEDAIGVVSEFLLFDKLCTRSLLLEFTNLDAVEFLKQTIQPFDVQVKL
jgi:signal transduction histidine kinase